MLSLTTENLQDYRAISSWYTLYMGYCRGLTKVLNVLPLFDKAAQIMFS